MHTAGYASIHHMHGRLYCSSSCAWYSLHQHVHGLICVASFYSYYLCCPAPPTPSVITSMPLAISDAVHDGTLCTAPPSATVSPMAHNEVHLRPPSSARDEMTCVKGDVS